MYLMHVGREPVYDVIQDFGMITFPPGEPVEVKDDYVAKRIMEHKKIQGLVEVPVIKNKLGVSFDMETARKNAREALAYGQKALIDNYIKEQQGRIAQNFPVLPPSPVVQRIAEEQGIDFKEYGLTPPGVKIGNKPAERIDALEAIVREIMEQNKLLMQKLEAFEKPKRG
jgi:hypothetical protein